MGFKILLRTRRSIIDELECQSTPLVVHWCTKKCKIIENLSARNIAVRPLIRRGIINFYTLAAGIFNEKL